MSLSAENQPRTANLEAPKHPHHPIYEGSGHFSRGTCSSCSWSYKGHIDEVIQSYETYHQQDRLVQPLPKPIEIPKPIGDPLLDALETRLIQLVAGAITYEHPTARYVARGLAEARALFLGEQLNSAMDYVADLTAKLAHMSNHQRAKLLQPSITRERMQEIIEASGQG